MKLPTTLLQTLAIAVTSLGLAGCESVTSNAPTNETPKPSGVVEPKSPTEPQKAEPNCPVNTPNNTRSPDSCPACGRG